MVTESLEIPEQAGDASVCAINPLKNSHQSVSYRILQVLTHIDQYYDNPSIWLNNVAFHMGVHPDYLGRKFKREIGIRFHDYLLLKRIQRAIPLLRSSAKSIKEISYVVGFNSPVIFSKVFKRFMGCSPRAYRSHNGLNRSVVGSIEEKYI